MTPLEQLIAQYDQAEHDGADRWANHLAHEIVAEVKRLHAYTPQGVATAKAARR